MCFIPETVFFPKTVSIKISDGLQHCMQCLGFENDRRAINRSP